VGRLLENTSYTKQQTSSPQISRANIAGNVIATEYHRHSTVRTTCMGLLHDCTQTQHRTWSD